MARKTTPGATGRGARPTKGTDEQEAEVAVQEVPQARRAEVVERPGPARARRLAGPTHEQIAQRAEEIWKRHGCPPGEDMENWLEAEAELKRKMGIQ